MSHMGLIQPKLTEQRPGKNTLEVDSAEKGGSVCEIARNRLWYLGGGPHCNRSCSICGTIRKLPMPSESCEAGVGGLGTPLACGETCESTISWAPGANVETSK